MSASTLFAATLAAFFQPPVPSDAPAPQAPAIPPLPRSEVGTSFNTGGFPLGATFAVADADGAIVVDFVAFKTVPQMMTRTVRVAQPDGSTQDRTESYTVMATVMELAKKKLPRNVKIYRNGREISADERRRLQQPTPIFITAIGTPNSPPGQGFEKIFGDALVVYIPYRSPPSPTVPAPASVTPIGEPAPIEREVIDKTNAARKDAGLPALTVDPTLMKAARQHSDNMAKQEKLDHVLDGKGPHDRLVDLGMQPSATGENIAQGQESAVDALSTWMSSEGHKGNILNPQFTHIGVAKADGPGGPYWTQVFVQIVMP